MLRKSSHRLTSTSVKILNANEIRDIHIFTHDISGPF